MTDTLLLKPKITLRTNTNPLGQLKLPDISLIIEDQRKPQKEEIITIKKPIKTNNSHSLF